MVGREDCTPAFDSGFVRASFEGSNALRITGTASALQRSQARWQALASAVEKIHVELAQPQDGRVAEVVSFDYPQEMVFLDFLLTADARVSHDATAD